MEDKIESLKTKLHTLEKARQEELEAKRKAFKFKGILTVKKENEKSFFRNLPGSFRNISISIHYENLEEAVKLGLSACEGSMKYHFLEGFIVSLGGGTCILDTPVKATEAEWRALCDGNIPEKFLKTWVKKQLK